MAQQRLPAEYHLLLDAIERLAFEHGQVGAELDELRRRLDRLESRVANLRQPEREQVVAHRVAPTPSIKNVTDLGVPEPRERTIPGRTTRPAPAAVFTRIAPVPAASSPVTELPAAPIATSSALVRVETPAATVREPIWSRIPDRYRRAAWITAPIVVVMAVSTWVTTAGTPDADPTATVMGGISGLETATPERTASPRVEVGTVATSTTDSATMGQATPPSPTATPPPVTSPTRQATSGVATATGIREAPVSPTASPAGGTATVGATATATATASPTASATPSPTVAVGPVELVPGGVGSTQTTVVATFGLASGEENGRAVYSEGSVLVTHGPETRAIRVTFRLDVDDFTMSVDDAEQLIAYYRPPDAQLLSTDTAQPGVVRRVYQSPTLTALFAGQDLGGRAGDRYVEELHFDPASQRAQTVEMAIGDQP